MGSGDQRYLTIKQAAVQLRVHPETLRKWVRQGRLTATTDRLHIGNPLLIEQQELNRFRDEMQGL